MKFVSILWPTELEKKYDKRHICTYVKRDVLSQYFTPAKKGTKWRVSVQYIGTQFLLPPIRSNFWKIYHFSYFCFKLDLFNFSKYIVKYTNFCNTKIHSQNMIHDRFNGTNLMLQTMIPFFKKLNQSYLKFDPGKKLKWPII